MRECSTTGGERGETSFRIFVKAIFNLDGIETHDLGRFCVLQPDLIEQKEISILFQMHFKLQRFFCSGQDTKAD